MALPPSAFKSVHGMEFGLAKGLALFDDVWLAGQRLAGLLASVTNSIVAKAGGTQTGAVALTTGINRVITVASGNDSVMLPIGVAGMCVLVIQDAASNSLQVFGNSVTADTIDGVASATGNAMAAAKRALFYCVTSGTTATPGTWVSLAGAKTS